MANLFILLPVILYQKKTKKKWLDHHLNKTGIKSLLRPSDENKMFAYQIKTTF